MEDIYEALGRPPCAEELKRWAIKVYTTDYIYEYSFDENIQVYCTTVELPQAMYDLDDTDSNDSPSRK